MHLQEGQTRKNYDVVVVGGGPAGVVATMQSASAGAKTLLIERGSTLGGTTVAGGVNFPGLFHAWGRQIIRGYGWKLVAQCVAESGGTLPDFSVIPERHWHHQVHVDRAVYTLLCDEFVSRSGADILFYTLPAHVVAREDGWRLTVCGKGGLEELDTRCLIDCTGDANVVALAGGELRVTGNERQPGTQTCLATGYDIDTLDLEQINRAFADAVARGELVPHDIGWSERSADVGIWLRRRGENANHISGMDARDSRGRSQMDMAGRRSILRLYRFLRRQPGLENLRLDYLAPECGVRETATIVGDVTVTKEDYGSGRCWDDALCYTFYTFDVHSSKGDGLEKRPLEKGVVPTIPRGALLPRGLNRIAVAGRCVSSDRDANGALRVQASSMAMGQVAGALAALAAEDGRDLRDVPLATARALLEKHDAIVPT